MASGKNPEKRREMEEMEAVPIPYPNDKKNPKYKEKTLQKNPDKLYYDQRRNGQICNLIFYTKDYEEWMETIKNEFSDLKETQATWFKLKDAEGTVCVYDSGKIVVYGELIDDFDEKFTKMSEKVGERKKDEEELSAQLEKVKVEETGRQTPKSRKVKKEEKK